MPWVICLVSASASIAQVPKPGSAPLRWGADQEGGAPFLFTPDDDPDRLIGFEVEVAAALAREMGVADQFVQCTWDQILVALDRGNFDVALNGYEYTPERASRYASSIPYYVYTLSLGVRLGSDEFTGWGALTRPTRAGGRPRVGVLQGSGADDYVTQQFGGSCEIMRYEGATEAMRLVETGQLDATVQDTPALQFYAGRRYPDLAIADEPKAPGFYVLYARQGDDALIAKINQAIRDLYQSGRLREIYDRYHIWNASQETLPAVWSTWTGESDVAQARTLLVLSRYFPRFLAAAGTTVLLSILAMPVAVGIGLAIALVRGSAPGTMLAGLLPSGIVGALLRASCTLYVEIVRGTPLAFQLFVIYFVLPEIGVTIDEFWAGVLALGVNYSAYEAEIYRLGLQAIPRGQMDAALSLGMSRGQAVTRIILPQAIRITIPATANDFIALFKDTAVCSVIAVMELSKQYSMAAKSTGLMLEMALLASALYLAMSYPLSLLAAWLERRLARETHP